MKIPTDISDEERQQLFIDLLTNKKILVNKSISKSTAGYHTVSRHTRKAPKICKPYKIVSK